MRTIVWAVMAFIAGGFTVGLVMTFEEERAREPAAKQSAPAKKTVREWRV